MVVGIVIATVVFALLLTMRWADRRDRARGHVNRSARDAQAAMRVAKERKLHKQVGVPREYRR